MSATEGRRSSEGDPRAALNRAGTVEIRLGATTYYIPYTYGDYTFVARFRRAMIMFPYGAIFNPAMFSPDAWAAFTEMSAEERLAWLESMRQAYGDGAIAALGLDVEALRAAGADPEYIAKITRDINVGRARHQVKEMIEKIGMVLGDRANLMTLWMLGNIDPPPISPDVPSLEPDLVWKLFREYWHEIVHRGMEIGVQTSHWLYGVNDFSYDQALYLVQSMWLAFEQVTGLDFTDPQQSAAIKSWLGGLSPRESRREFAPDWHRGSEQERRERLQRYIDYGGPSRKLMEEQGQTLGPMPSQPVYGYEVPPGPAPTPLEGIPPGWAGPFREV